MINKAEQKIIEQALSILKREVLSTSFVTGPQFAKDFIKLQLATLEHEVFAVLFLNTQHQMISFDILFRGTVDGASVYPREVAKEALYKNASAVVLAHNHPSNIERASQADQQITKVLSDALALFDIQVLDHIIVTKDKVFSFAERGLL